MSAPEIAEVVDILDQLQRRVVHEAVASATSATWRRRAEMFRWSAPRPEDFTGEATEQEIEDRRRRCLQVASFCEYRAKLAEGDHDAAFPSLTCPTCMTETSPWSCSCGETWIGAVG